MAKLKEGPQFVIDVMVTYQLIGNPEFWEAAPPGLLDDIRDSAREAYEKALAIARGDSCPGCNSIRAALTDTHNEIGRRLAGVQAVAAEWRGFDPLVDFITRKRGYRPRPIIMFYKDTNGVTAKLEL